ncbi:MAG TPA: hypothetical protein VFH78_11070 [Candidatus Thermoplasmatota archaeon]|nr:hypothetical protein [Candidatus Thermoplasmatota archaeon]
MKARPWSAYALRLLCSVLMFLSGYALLAGSTFALRLRGDVPVQLIVLAMAGVFSFLPLLFGRRYLGMLLVSGFILSGIGAYWWSTIPWDEFIKESNFTTEQKPGLLDYALVASPAIIAAFYAAVSRASILRADLKNRGADADEISRAASVSFLSGAALLVFCGGLAVALWALMATGIVFQAVAPIPTGVPALILVAALVAVSWAIFTRRLPRFPGRKARERVASPAAAPAPGAPARRGLMAKVRALTVRGSVLR